MLPIVRRRTVGLVLTALLVASSSALVGAVDHSASNESDDWSAPRADAGRTGATTDAGPQPYANVSWSQGGQVGATMTFEADPVVAGDTVYMAHGGEDRANGFVEAYDAETGETEWRQPNVGEAVGTPTVRGGSVYVATSGPKSRDFPDSVNTSGLYSLDAETGVVEWRQNATITEPLVADGLVFTSLRDDERINDQPYRNVTALDPDTGERVWTADVHGKPAGYANGTLYVTNDETNTVSALDPATGTVEWEVAADDDAVFDEGFAVTESVFVYTNDTGPAQLGEPKTEKTVYVHSARDGDRLWERDLSASLPGSTPYRISEPAVADGTVYLVSDDDRGGSAGSGGQDVGAVHALDAETGETDWRFETAEELVSSPVVGDGSVYVTGTATYALDAETGTEQWNLSSDASAFVDGHQYPVSAAVADGRLLVTVRSQALPPQWMLYTLESRQTVPGPDYRVGDDEPVAENNAPFARIDTTPEVDDGYFPPGETVTLNASGSYDLDGNVTEYRWYLDGEQIGTGRTVNVTTFHPACSQRRVRLEVADDGIDGDRSRTDSTTITLQTEP